MKHLLFLLTTFFVVQTTFALTEENPFFVLDMVHHNPGEPYTKTMFTDPAQLAEYGYKGQVINEFTFVHCAITYDSLNVNIFPKGSTERQWVDNLAEHIRTQIAGCHKYGLKAYFFTDIIVFPKRLIELYAGEICNEKGKIDMALPKTQEIHRIMLREVFARFPDLDGLVIRTGETYTNNIPYHAGNNPVDYKSKDEGIKNHVILMNLLRDEVCVRQNKTLFYRTWDFGYFHTRPDYYLAVTGQVEPHPNLFMSIKHTNGDYFRTFKFNKTLTLGKHKQIVEVQCQREYEGKGAYPNYIANAVIYGFEEYKNDNPPRGLNDIKDNPLFSGVWTWSRGGGWQGPYITNELWCDLNTYVMSHWAQDMNRSEENIFNEYALKKGVAESSLPAFRKLCLLTPDAIIRGRGSLIHPINVIWTRDHFLGGLSRLKGNFDAIIAENKVQAALDERHEAVQIWGKIVKLSRQIKCSDKATAEYIRVSSEYGYYLYAIMEQGWVILLKGYEGDQAGKYDVKTIHKAIQKYDDLWKKYAQLKEKYPSCATLYLPEYLGGPKNVPGMGESIDKYRNLN